MTVLFAAFAGLALAAVMLLIGALAVRGIVVRSQIVYVLYAVRFLQGFLVVSYVLVAVTHITASAFHVWGYTSVFGGIFMAVVVFPPVLAAAGIWATLLMHILINMKLAGPHCNSEEIALNRREIERGLRCLRWFHRLLFRLRGLNPDVIQWGRY